jgi:hypothetical protein
VLIILLQYSFPKETRKWSPAYKNVQRLQSHKKDPHQPLFLNPLASQKIEKGVYYKPKLQEETQLGAKEYRTPESRGVSHERRTKIGPS